VTRVGSRPFKQVDVFSAVAYRGNALAVVLDGAGLTTDEMQRFAHWTNLSETTFVLPPTDPAADYRVRIFTPTLELPFAGHPTLGTAHAWLEAGGAPRGDGEVVQECGAGLVRVRRGEAGRLAFAAPPLVRSGEPDAVTLDRVVAVLGVDRDSVVAAQWVDNGPGWIGVLLRSAGEVLAVRPGPLDGFDIGIVGPQPAGSDTDFEVRAFFPQGSLTVEDPVTGSLNASLAQWLIGAGIATAPYRARQGTVLGRAGLVQIDQPEPGGDIWVGGASTTAIDGHVVI
jgi:PhzF family phenazine biosynthesis protein